ncbi:MAG: DUF3078 domain-containing protein [Bacteroidota bacterium]
MRKGFILFLLSCSILLANQSFAQNTDELMAQKEAKAKELAELEGQLGDLQGKVDALKGEVASLTDQLTPYPRWSTGLLGTVGLNVAGFSNWLSKDQPNTNATTIGLTAGAFANLQQEKYFWNNGGNLALSWLRFVDKDAPDTPDDPEFQIAADALNATSLFGYKLNDKLAISALGEVRTATQRGTFFNPGYLDIGAGATWTPIPNLVAVFHPLNYNFVFSNDDEVTYESSLGLKAVVDYSAKLTENIAWKSNLSTFFSYKDVNNFSNWTWVNTFSTAYKGIGIGLDIGLRGNKQESFNAFNSANPTNILSDIDNLDSKDNGIQAYYVLGLAYNLTSN